MTLHARLTGPDAMAQEVRIKLHLSHAVGLAVQGGMTAPLCEALSGALEILGAGMPSPPDLEHLRYDAEHWADIAAPMEIEAYVAAGLRRIERATFAEKARKRAFMTLWRSFTPQQQADFIKAMTEKEG